MRPTTPVTEPEVLPNEDLYGSYIFVFTPPCTKDCANCKFGVSTLGEDTNLLLKGTIKGSSLVQVISACVGPMVKEYDSDKYYLINYDDAEELQSELLKASVPLAMFAVFCPPCISSIQMAVALCSEKNCKITQWQVRVDHRLSCKCCTGKDDSLARIRMVADTVADVESGNHWATIDDPQAKWVKYIDRAWLDLQLYHCDELADSVSSRAATPDRWTRVSGIAESSLQRDYEGIRQMLTCDIECHSRDKTIAVILSDVENAAWILSTLPFPAVKREPRASEIYHLKKKGYYGTGEMQTLFKGTFTIKGSLKRRREESPPPTDLPIKPQMGDGHGVDGWRFA